MVKAERDAAKFPVLTDGQMARLAMHGRTRRVAEGDVLVTLGEANPHFYVLRSGRLDVVRRLPNNAGEDVFVQHAPGEFTGEVSLLAGRRALVEVRAGLPSEVIDVAREDLLAVIQSDSELSEILMRAFILRRIQLIDMDAGNLVLLGSLHNGDTLRIREFLTRNGQPFHFEDLDRNPAAQETLDHFNIDVSEVPIVISHGAQVLKRPGIRQVADLLGLNENIDVASMRDLVIVGAGPAGLAAAVYGGSEGLHTLLIEADVPGGQAGSSSKIENYLGFPTGISGYDLTGRAYHQAQKFGAQFMTARRVTRLRCDQRPYTVEMEDGTQIPTRAIILAIGARYRKLDLPNLAQYEGAGIYYGCTFLESQLCQAEEVVVVGGGNSAGQAAVFLAQTARKVDVLIRGAGLAETMSRYLIDRIEKHPRIAMHTFTEIEAVEGDGHVERVTWKHNKTGARETRNVRHVFVMTGASPQTEWLRGCLALDAQGFVRTGASLTPEDLTAVQWTLSRPPLLLETSRPGVFAVGDVRSGNVKRVASAVGEGAIAVALVHQAIQQ